VPVRLARCQYMLNRKEDAWRTLDAAIAKDPGNGLALRTMGQFSLSESRPADAETHLRKAAAALPDDYQAHWFLYDSLRQQGKPDAPEKLKQAEAVRDRSERLGDLQSRRLAEQPLDPALHVEMAAILIRAGKNDLAMTWLNSALSLDANFRPAHRMLAEHYSKTGNSALAAEHRKLAEE
jgi:predicted Zn-dependent protease